MVNEADKKRCEGCAWLNHPVTEKMMFCKWWQIKVFAQSLPCDYWEEYFEPF